MIMIKSQKLYEAYDCLEGNKLLQRVQEVDSVYHRLKESTKLLSESNKIAFFLINFMKDFEQKLVYNPNLRRSNIMELIKSVHQEYSCSIMNFNVEEYEKVIEDNTRMLEDQNTKDRLKDLKIKLDNLHQEFQNHRSNNTEDLRDLSAITGKDTSCINTSISVNLTGNTLLPEENNLATSSNTHLT